MSTTARPLIGREDELASIARLLDARDELPGAVVLHGEAGIGKTSVWLAGLDAARERGYRALSCRPSEAETRLAYAGLTDLLGAVAHDVLPALPPIQTRALGAAMLLGETDVPVDERAVAAAFLAALRHLAGDGPLCLAVDDLQWLDLASVAAARFALARLVDEPIATLLTVRDELPPWLLRSGPETKLARIEMGGLSVGALHELLRTRLDASFPRPTLLRLWETSNGSPFLALELAEALRSRGVATLAPGEPLPIPSTLEELIRERLRGLSAPARDAARVVAAVAEPTPDIVEAALGHAGVTGLDEALDARILELDGARLRFTHPLLGSVVTINQTASQRRSLHARLAKVVSTVQERARHLALATTGPDRVVASTLERAARSVRAGGAPEAAAELAEEALRFTPATSREDRRRRRLVAAELHARAGDTHRSLALLEIALAEAAPGDQRAIVLTQMADVHSSPNASIPLYGMALAEAGEDDVLRATIHLGLASRLRWSVGAEEGFEHASLALQAAVRTADDALRCRALGSFGDLHFRSGRGIAVAEMEEALAIERSLAGWPLHGGPTWSYCDQLCWSADVEGAREFVDGVRAVLTAHGDPAIRGFVSWFTAFNEWRAGNWEEADTYANDVVDIFTQLGQLIPPYEIPAAVIAAHRARIDDARERATAAIALAESTGIEIARSIHGWVLGFVDLSLGRVSEALTHLRRSYALRNVFVLEPGMRPELGDLLEALIASGELDEAEEIIRTWQVRAEAVDRAWALAILARGRGLLLAARGDLDGAIVSFEHALAEHARCSVPFDHARTLLALGRTQRRGKKRAAARITLDDALARFETLGAPLWADQARAELARIGGRTSSRDELTEAERRIATLVAEGRTNREVAAALFLTQRSVETALTRIYRKLGVRSRAELARRSAANT